MKVLLYSGGMDSWLIDKLWKPDVKLYVDIDGAYSEVEKSRLPSDVEIVHFPLGLYEDAATKYIPLRNLYFLMLASNYGDEICLGATAGDYGAIDKRPEFLDIAEQILNYCLQPQSVSGGKTVRIEKRFVKLSKYEIMAEYLSQGGTIKEAIESTFSCFDPKEDGTPCLFCKPCFRKFMLGYYFGYPYTMDEKRQMVAYIKKHVLNHKAGSGTYYADRVGEGVYLAAGVERLLREVENAEM